jgi:integrase
MKFEKTDRDFLEMEEIARIYNKEFMSDRLEKVKDVFLFCCYTGLAYSDIRDLEKQDIKTGTDGNLWIMSERNKSKVDFKVLLLDIPKSILKKYEGKQKDGKLLPVVCNKNMNEYLHEIATICGIEKKITSHVARHSNLSSLLKTSYLQL